VHRALADPRVDGRATVTRLHDVLAETVPLAPLRQVLDAGCGLGGTMLYLAERCGASFTGVTLSEAQAAAGRRAAARAGLGERVRIVVGSYDEPPEGLFDLVVAIESLAHSESPALSIAALAARLAPGGQIAIVDDFPLAAARGTSDLALFQSGWRLPALPTAEELGHMLTAQGLSIATERDLTPETRPRTLVRIAALEALNLMLRALAPPRAKPLLDSYRGGLALERLYRRALIRYRLVVARRDV
jgi:cyclopropane fatty-acyl-phospholipid synthase-like methyltransferase